LLLSFQVSLMPSKQMFMADMQGVQHANAIRALKAELQAAVSQRVCMLFHAVLVSFVHVVSLK
jgi:hypothetical protein